MDEKYETFNEFFVGLGGFDGGVVVVKPVSGPLSRERAIRLAATIVAVADPDCERFTPQLKAILES